MEVSDLLSFKPETVPKRKQDDDEAKAAAQSQKKPKFDEKILQLLDANEEDTNDDDALDEMGLKKIALVFEKRILNNHEKRLKYAEEPQKFMESEMDLHDAIKQLQAVSTVPDLYPLLISLNVVASMLELLSHPNTDIAAVIIEVIMEFTDVDILHESTEGSEALIDCLQEQSITKLLVSNCLDRLDETIKEESDAVHNTLSIFENLTEFRPESCAEIAEQGLMQWILKRLKIKTYDANKLYCSEILSILLQNTNENRVLLGTIEGIDILLQQLATYKRHDPVTDEEKEYMENLFNCLCSSLLAKENRSNFLNGEGCQLMNLMLREKKLSRNGALKVLDYACAGNDGKENCQKLVEILGLRTIFPLFMKTPRNKQRILSSEEYEEHVCSIISSMLRNTKASQKQRLLSKFVENDFEKVDRLMELHLKYLEKVETIDKEIMDQKNFKRPGEDNDEDDDEEGNYLKRLSGGLFTLQLIDYIILEAAISPDGPKIKQRIQQILNLHGQPSLKVIKDVMREYAGNLGDDAHNVEWREQEKQHVLSLINRF